MAQTLPPELLSKIFFECLPSVLTPPVLSIAPMNVSLVCRSWRALALERSDLWATMQLSDEDLDRCLDAYPDRHRSIYRLLSRIWRFWLERSRDAPLVVLLDLHKHLDEGPQKEAHRIYRALVANQHRWRAVTIDHVDMAGGSDGSFLWKLTPSPLLEKLIGFIRVRHTLRNSTYPPAIAWKASHWKAQSMWYQLHARCIDCAS